MKQLARFAAVLIAGAALAACSGNQGVTPTGAGTAPMQPSFAKQPAAVRVSGDPEIIRVSSHDIEFAKTFKAGQKHIFMTADHMSTKPDSGVGYPADMQCAVYGGKCTTMPSSNAYNIYVSIDGKHCVTEKCWGHPEEFLKALAGSAFAGLETQYKGGPASGYKYGGHLAVTYPHYTNVFYDNDLLAILSAAANKIQAVGPVAEYHLFIPPGYDVCNDFSTQCYSPDNPSTLVFCAYHSSVYVPSIKQFIIFSVEPYMFTPVKTASGSYYPCRNADPSLPPSEDNFQASVLGHESFESWSDPIFDPYPQGYTGRFGEVGDVCAYAYFTNVKAKAMTFNVQEIYSNKVHGCNNQ